VCVCNLFIICMQLKHILKWIYVTFFTENALIFINGTIYMHKRF